MSIFLPQLIQNPFFIFFPIFLTLYLTGYFLIFKNWPHKSRPEASSCFISLFHGTPAAFLATFSLYTSPKHQTYFSQNTLFQNLVLEYSIAYFTMDLTHYLVFYPSDFMFIGHHLATLFVFITCRLISHGGYSILVLLILAEITSFLQNLWTLASARRVELEFADKVYKFLSIPFYVLYTIARGVLGPLFVYGMGCAFVKGENVGVISNWVVVSWIGVIVTAICVSVLWVWNLWVDFLREYKSCYCNNVEKKIH